jgi:3',5'-cyclic AMP phosphodiesterase CpdA
MASKPSPPSVMHRPDPDLSLFQSAVAASEQRARAKADATIPPGTLPPVDHGSPMLRALAQAATSLRSAAPASAAAGLRAGLAPKVVEECASRYLARALAEVRRDPAAIAAAQAALPPFGTCDGRWIEALNDFVLHAALRRHSDVPYRVWTSLDDFVLPDPRDPEAAPLLADRARVAFLSDWGTGEARPQALLRAAADLRPDILIHLGDIYYAGSLPECDSFLSNVRAVFPSLPVFTLCGNHDMYSGGAPYYALLDRLGQPASYFCLRNAHWQLLGMDTGFNDANPFREERAMTWLRDGTGADGAEVDTVSEVEWLADKVARAAGRRTILLSHHPLFTRHAPIAGTEVCNTRLLAQVRPWLSEVTLWLWGHEHCQQIFQPFAGLTRGRCLGASAIPTLPSERPYEAATGFSPGQAPPGLLDDPAARLGIDPVTGWHDLGFGLLELDGIAADMTYYGYNQTSGARALFSERLP